MRAPFPWSATESLGREKPQRNPDMKTISTLALAVAVAVIGTSTAFADDQQLQNRLALQRQAAQRNQTTVAVYAGRHGVGHRSTMQNKRSESRFEWRTNARGQGFGVYVPVK